MYSKLGTVIAIIAAIFPFAAVIASLAQSESAFTAIVVTVIVAAPSTRPLTSRKRSLPVRAPASTTGASRSPKI